MDKEEMILAGGGVTLAFGLSIFVMWMTGWYQPVVQGNEIAKRQIEIMKESPNYKKCIHEANSKMEANSAINEQNFAFGMKTCLENYK